MMPWDWIGMVTIRSDTRRRTSISGTISFRPGSRTPTTRPSRNSTPRSYCLTIRTDSASPSRATTANVTTRAMNAPIPRFLSFVSNLAYRYGRCRFPGPGHTDCRRPMPFPVLREPASFGFQVQVRPSPGQAGLLGACRLGACRRDARLTGAGAHLDLDVLGLGLLPLGQHDLQHAVVGGGLDRVGQHMGGQGDRATEGAIAALDPVEVLLG